MTLVKESIATLTLSTIAVTVIIGLPTIALYVACNVIGELISFLAI